MGNIPHRQVELIGMSRRHKERMREVPKKLANAWANWIAILLWPLIYPFVGDEVDSPTKGVDRFVHPFQCKHGGGRGWRFESRL